MDLEGRTAAAKSGAVKSECRCGGRGQSEMKIETIEEIMLRRVPPQTFSGCCKDRLYLSFLGNLEAPHYFKDTTCVSNIRQG